MIPRGYRQREAAAKARSRQRVVSEEIRAQRALQLQVESGEAEITIDEAVSTTVVTPTPETTSTPEATGETENGTGEVPEVAPTVPETVTAPEPVPAPAAAPEPALEPAKNKGGRPKKPA